MSPAREGELSGWGGLPAPGREVRSENLAQITLGATLTRGLGRSYGDSSLPAAGVEAIPASPLADRILGFDPETGLLRAEAGLSLLEINRLFWARGWTFPVLPGTQFVTLGGMVAVDVHGKNHHVEGSLGRHVEELTLRTADDRIVICSRAQEPELFFATLGGMGLTGHILVVSVRLLPIPSPWIWSETERVSKLDNLLETLRAAAEGWPYTVAWFDALAQGQQLGRGIIYRGRWASDEEAPDHPPRSLRRVTVPLTLPSWVLNRLSVRLFNSLIFRRHPRSPKKRAVHPESFFHPLDGVRHWNRIYGRRGFTQHQCVLPEARRPGAVRRFLEELTSRGGASFLCVIKDCGAEGEGLLSFPFPGVSVAVDLPVRDHTQALIDALNEKVIEEGGRIYLAKDAFTRASHFALMEPRLERFAAVRAHWDPAGRLASAQSRRLLEDPS